MLTHFPRVIKVGVLPSRRVMLHANQRYYDPIGLPLPSKEWSRKQARNPLRRLVSCNPSPNRT